LEAKVHFSTTESIFVVLAITIACVQGYTLRILDRRKLRSEFPVFYRYSLFCGVGALITIIPYLFFCPQYFYIYWVLTPITMLLEFGVLYELLVNALKPYSALIDLGKMLFRWAAVFLIMAALLTAFATTGSGTNRLVAAAQLLERTVRLMQCGLLLLFLGLEKRLGLSWRTHSMSIALGLGVYAAVDLSATYLISRAPAQTNAFQMVATLVYLSATSLWAYSLAKPEPARGNVLDSPRRLIFQRWNEALLTHSVRGEMAFASGGMDSFLPGVEQTVDRVLARKIVQ
jgi:hypothetical protein